MTYFQFQTPAGTIRFSSITLDSWPLSIIGHSVSSSLSFIDKVFLFILPTPAARQHTFTWLSGLSPSWIPEVAICGITQTRTKGKGLGTGLRGIDERREREMIISSFCWAIPPPLLSLCKLRVMTLLMGRRMETWRFQSGLFLPEAQIMGGNNMCLKNHPSAWQTLCNRREAKAVRLPDSYLPTFHFHTSQYT